MFVAPRCLIRNSWKRQPVHGELIPRPGSTGDGPSQLRPSRLRNRLRFHQPNRLAAEVDKNELSEAENCDLRESPPAPPRRDARYSAYPSEGEQSQQLHQNQGIYFHANREDFLVGDRPEKYVSS